MSNVKLARLSGNKHFAGKFSERRKATSLFHDGRECDKDFVNFRRPNHLNFYIRMTMISKAAVGIAVGIAGIFVGYCFYFDQKRRSDPDFKKKLRERKFGDFFFFPLDSFRHVRIDIYHGNTRIFKQTDVFRKRRLLFFLHRSTQFRSLR